ncbi:MAG TPA: hypothetical protein VD927_04355 [Chryseosolibacter sp.]|nr:hypothetical protein [Chryseosolibacter sp.]
MVTSQFNGLPIQLLNGGLPEDSMCNCHATDNLDGLGADTATKTKNLQQITAIVGTLNSILPNVNPVYQSSFSKFSQKVSNIAGMAAQISSEVPGGQTAALVLGVVGGAAALLSKVFSGSKAKQLAAQRGEYERLIIEIRNDNKVLDDQIETLRKGIEMLTRDLQSLSGLGLCIIGCKAKREKEKLNATKADYDLLISYQQDKIRIVNNLLGEYEKLLEAVTGIKQSKTLHTILTWSIGFLALSAISVAFIKRRKKNSALKELSREPKRASITNGDAKDLTGVRSRRNAK